MMNSHSESGAGRILVVDDLEDNARLLCRFLARDGYESVMAFSGAQALQEIEAGTPDVVLLDVMMPEMDGYEVCRQIRANPATRFLPVVMVTALQELVNKVQALEAGADDFLTKPVDRVELSARVRSLVRVKRQRDELEQAYIQLQRLESMRESLSAMLVHDLRTPLTSIVGSLETLRSGEIQPLEPLSEELVEISTRTSYQLLGIINDLLDVSRMESDQLVLNRSPVNVPVLLDAAVEQVAGITVEQTIEIICETASDVPDVSADEDLLRRVLVNLIGNAIKFAPPGSAINIRALPGSMFAVSSTPEAPWSSASQVSASLSSDPIGERVHPARYSSPAASQTAVTEEIKIRAILFSVEDRGEGIPYSEQERIFDKFGQVETRKSGRKMSTGLGLTFCKLAVEAHGGRIWVRSTPGAGTVFYFSIPL